MKNVLLKNFWKFFPKIDIKMNFKKNKTLNSVEDNPIIISEK